MFISLEKGTSKDRDVRERGANSAREEELEERRRVKTEELIEKLRKTITSHSLKVEKRIWEKKEIVLSERRVYERVLALRFGLNKEKRE